MLIYKATNLINGKVYIGQTTQSLLKRKKEHIIKGLRHFCIEHGLSEKVMGRVANGKASHHKKWLCYKLEGVSK